MGKNGRKQKHHGRIEPHIEPPSTGESPHPETSPDRPAFEVLYPKPSHTSAQKPEIERIKGQRVRWLQDDGMLPYFVPQARILAYRYESRWHKDAPVTRLQLCGEDLVEAVHAFRQGDERDRPLLFLAHSLGGLVVEYGLLQADRQAQFRYLVNLTVGFVALGAPFRGTKMKTWADLAAKLLSRSGSDTGIIDELAFDDATLRDKTDELCKLRERLSLPTLCAFENRKTTIDKYVTGSMSLWKGKIIVEEQSACVSGWPRLQLNKNHAQLNKFSGPQDDAFQRVAAKLEEMVQNSSVVLDRRKSVIRKTAFMVPFERNKHYIDRGALLPRLLDMLPPAKSPSQCKKVSVEGLGGIGKTQLVLEAAYCLHEQEPDLSIFWLPATDATMIRNALRDIGLSLGLKGLDGMGVLVESLVEKALRETDKPWLLIIDNADDPSLLFGPGLLFDSEAVGSKPLFNENGTVLLTSRSKDVTRKLDINWQDVIRVQAMSPKEAFDLLTSGLPTSQLGPPAKAEQLVERLTYLPLAIKQASSYMARHDASASDYLRLFCQGDGRASDQEMLGLLKEPFTDRHRYPDSEATRNPVATTWLISFTKMSPKAADLLKFICFLFEKNIPEELIKIKDEPAKQYLEAIGELKAYSFVTVTQRDGGSWVDMHRLVRLATRNWIQETGHWVRWLEASILRLDRNVPVPDYKGDLPEHKRDTAWAACMPHIQTVIHENGRPQPPSDAYDGPLASLLYKDGLGFTIMGLFHRAEHDLRLALGLFTHRLGSTHRTTLQCAAALAANLQNQGKFAEASSLLGFGPAQNRVLDISLETITQRLNSIFERNALRRVTAVVVYYRGSPLKLKPHMSNIPIFEVLANQSIHTREFDFVCNFLSPLLAQASEKSDEEHEESDAEHEESDTEHEESDAEHEQWDAEHPGVYRLSRLIAICFAGGGKNYMAAAYFEDLMKGQQKVLGHKHRDTLLTKSQLGLAQNMALELPQYAENTHRELLSDMEELLGRKHPDTIMATFNLVHCLALQQRHEEALTMQRELLETARETMGERSMLFMDLTHGLGEFFANAWKFDESKDAFEQATRMKISRLGLCHPSTYRSVFSGHCAEIRLVGKDKYGWTETHHRYVGLMIEHERPLLNQKRREEGLPEASFEELLDHVEAMMKGLRTVNFDDKTEGSFAFSI